MSRDFVNRTNDIGISGKEDPCNIGRRLGNLWREKKQEKRKTTKRKRKREKGLSYLQSVLLIGTAPVRVVRRKGAEGVTSIRPLSAKSPLPKSRAHCRLGDDHNRFRQAILPSCCQD